MIIKICDRRHIKKFHVIKLPCCISLNFITIEEKYRQVISDYFEKEDFLFLINKKSYIKINLKRSNVFNIFNKNFIKDIKKEYKNKRLSLMCFKNVDCNSTIYLSLNSKSEMIKWKLKNT